MRATPPNKWGGVVRRGAVARSPGRRHRARRVVPRHAGSLSGGGPLAAPPGGPGTPRAAFPVSTAPNSPIAVARSSAPPPPLGRWACATPTGSGAASAVRSPGPATLRTLAGVPEDMGSRGPRPVPKEANVPHLGQTAVVQGPLRTAGLKCCALLHPTTPAPVFNEHLRSDCVFVLRP